MSITDKSQKCLEYDKVLNELSCFAKTAQSKEMCLNLTPYVKSEDIEFELICTREAKFILDNAKDIPVDNIENFEHLKLKNEYFKEEELINIAKSMRTFRLVRNFLKENLSYETNLSSISNELYSNKAFEDGIFDLFDENYTIKKNANPELYGLYSSLQDTENSLKQKVQQLINSSDFQSHLQENIYTLRDERIVFQVKASEKSKVPGIVHDVSATNKTFYIEPAQIVPLNNKIRELKFKIYAEVIRILTEVSRAVRKELPFLIQSEQRLAKIDLIFAKARYAVKTNSIEPEINKDRFIKIDLMRHPLLIGRIENIVENDFLIGKDYKSIIITGSNTGGKTVTLKTVGLFILMMKSGMFLPCAEAHIYPYDTVLADIGDEQNILQNLSTFSSHMKNVIKILELANNDSFVLIDELCAGTDPQEGAILAEVILKELAKKEATSIITTHYGELKTLEYTNPYFKNASVEFNSETLRPTYKLIIGIPGMSNAITISSNLGLKEDLVWSAKELLITRRDNTGLAIEKLQDTQLQLDNNLKEAEKRNAQAEDLKLYYEKELGKHIKEKKKTLKNLQSKFETEINSAKDEIKDILKELREEKSEKVARRSYQRLAKIEQVFRNDLTSNEESEIYREPNWDSINVNDKLMIKELNQAVTVLTLPDKNNCLFIRMGMIKTKIKKDRLAIFDEKLAKTTNLPKFSKETFVLKKYNITNTLDLRGTRVEEGLDKLEKYLDTASLANLSPVYIIHGHGTGALKSAVRDFVSTSPYVAKYRIGEDAEGGDGVCVIDIK
ncbi:MAG: endonuclease MutS2 [bacterium]|nr:endonuclease MutS2 [bacterium]